MTKPKNDMTIKDAIDELKGIAERTNDEEVLSGLKCAIEDLTAYMNAPQNDERCVSENVAELIQGNNSAAPKFEINKGWVRKLHSSVSKMFEYSQDAVATAKDKRLNKKAKTVKMVSNVSDKNHHNAIGKYAIVYHAENGSVINSVEDIKKAIEPLIDKQIGSFKSIISEKTKTTINDDVVNSIKSTLVAQADKITAEFCRVEGRNNWFSEQIEIKLESVLTKLQEDLESNNSKVIECINNSKKTAAEIQEDLSKLQGDFDSQAYAMFSKCNEILVIAQRTQEIVGEKAVGLQDIKTLFERQILLSEKRHEQIMTAIRKDVSMQSSQLDLHVVADMLTWFKEYSDKRENETEQDNFLKNHREYVETELSNINEYLGKIDYNLANVTEMSEKILGDVSYTKRQVDKLVNLCEKLNSNLVGYDEVSADIKKMLLRLNAENEEKLSEGEQKKINALESKLDLMISNNYKLKEELADALSTGYSISSECPRCKVRAQRKLIGGECKCEVCGNRFSGINPDMSGITDDELKKYLDAEKDNAEEFEEKKKQRRDKYQKDQKFGDGWRARHTAVLESVGENLYRMKLNEEAVSRSGILIIPPKDNKGHAIKKIAFCQPNTYALDEQEMLKKVKKLFLPKDIELEKYQGTYPFSEIEELKTVVSYSYKLQENGFEGASDKITKINFSDPTEDTDKLKQIKNK